MHLFKQKYDLTTLSDEELVGKYKSSRKEVYIGELYKRYSHLIFLVCVKYLKDREAAKDGVMDIFEELIKTLPNRTIGYFKGWIYAVTRNHCLMQLRKTNVFERLEDVQEKNSLNFMENDGFLHLIEKEKFRSKDILKKLELLKDDQKECLKIFYLEKKSYKEISLLVEISENKVKSNIQNGKRNLKLILEKEIEHL
ncbi:MAG: sigma-70 family RNA polymerase sigma factor [Melioribacteraceae bacterium]|nr:sigma-70 family RNA polymerase sigma factor [Melioribacteraceae bacterium]